MMTAVYQEAPPQPPNESAYVEPGSLGIKERRSWQTWHLLTAVAVAVVIGMMIGHSGGSGKSGSAQGGEAQGVFKLPPRPGSGGDATVTSAVSSATSSAGASTSPTTPSPTQTTLTSQASPAGQSTTTTAASGLAASPAAAGGEVVLMEKTTGSGTKVLPSFTTGGVWKIGWAFRCSSASGQFQIFVVPDGGTPATQAAVNKQGTTGQEVTAQTSTGSQHLEIRSTCNWAVKVTGISG